MTSKAKSDTNIKVLKGPDGKQYNHTMDPFADSFVLKAENKVLDYIKRVRVFWAHTYSQRDMITIANR